MRSHLIPFIGYDLLFYDYWRWNQIITIPVLLLSMPSIWLGHFDPFRHQLEFCEFSICLLILFIFMKSQNANETIRNSLIYYRYATVSFNLHCFGFILLIGVDEILCTAFHAQMINKILSRPSIAITFTRGNKASGKKSKIPNDRRTDRTNGKTGRGWNEIVHSIHEKIVH